MICSVHADEKEMEILMEELGMIQDELTLHVFILLMQR